MFFWFFIVFIVFGLLLFFSLYVVIFIHMLEKVGIFPHIFDYFFYIEGTGKNGKKEKNDVSVLIN